MSNGYIWAISPVVGLDFLRTVRLQRECRPSVYLNATLINFDRCRMANGMSPDGRHRAGPRVCCLELDEQQQHFQRCHRAVALSTDYRLKMSVASAVRASSRAEQEPNWYLRPSLSAYILLMLCTAFDDVTNGQWHIFWEDILTHTRALTAAAAILSLSRGKRRFGVGH